MPDANKFDPVPMPTGDPPPGLLSRVWLAVPAWAFQAAGAVIFLGYVAFQLPAYFDNFKLAGRAYFGPGISRWYVPWGKVLIDLNFLIIGLAFILRAPAKKVASRPRDIVIPVIAAFWPMFPFWTLVILGFLGQPNLGLVGPGAAQAYRAFMFDTSRWTPTSFMAGAALIIAGNVLDIWGYFTLFRSISIVPEARQLKTGGPYRFVRHPVYFGQLLAQGGLWLVLARTHVVWIAFFACFATMQLYRSRLEEEVLERFFGDDYRAYRKRALWFWR